MEDLDLNLEDFVAKNQKYILGFLTAVAVVTIGYLMYQKFIAGPNEQEAADDLFVAQQNFQKATEGTLIIEGDIPEMQWD